MLFFWIGPAFLPAADAPPVAWAADALAKEMRRADISAPATPAQAQSIARAAGGRLLSLCPHCRLDTIAAEGPCGWARQQRHVIRRAARAGLDADTIVATYVEVYGDRIRPPDPRHGAASWSWRLPYLVGAVAFFVLIGVGWWRIARTPSRPVTTDPATGVRADSKLRAHLAEALEAWDTR